MKAAFFDQFTQTSRFSRILIVFIQGWPAETFYKSRRGRHDLLARIVVITFLDRDKPSKLISPRFDQTHIELLAPLSLSRIESVKLP